MSKAGERDETQMLARILGGETQLFHELIRPYERTVYMVALGMLKDEGEAEDTAQEAFLKAYTGLNRFRSESKFSTWLISITINEARSKLRKRKNLRTESLDGNWDGEGEDQVKVSPAVLTDWREIPSEVLERGEVRGILRAAVTALPAIYREIFVLREVKELSVNEASEVLGISGALVKVRLHRARMMLQKTLAPQLKNVAVPVGSKRRRFPWF
jgi:RNA polymerase sigma-70 factor (ECF subfamily)